MSQVNINNPVTFDGTDLTTISGLTVLSTNPYRPAKRRIVIGDIVRSDRSKHNSANYANKVIAVRVGISRATRPLLETSIDSLMGILQGREKELILPQAGAKRKYYATYSDYEVNKEGGSYIELDLLFNCSNRLGYDLESILLKYFTGYTSYHKVELLTFGGSAEWQTPVSTITFVSVSGGSGRTVSIGNDGTGQSVSITRNWVSGDLLVVDSFNSLVTVNGDEVQFTGTVPAWKTGTGYWFYNDTFSTSRSITGQVRHVRSYV